MSVDITLIRTILKVLELHEGRKPAPTEELIAIDAEGILRRPLLAHHVRGALVECKRQGWASEGADEFRQPTWEITAAGTEKVRGA